MWGGVNIESLKQDCSNFIPHRLVEMNADANAIDSLAAFPFLNNPSVLNNLKLELPTCVGLAQDISCISPQYQHAVTAGSDVCGCGHGQNMTTTMHTSHQKIKL